MDVANKDLNEKFLFKCEIRKCNGCNYPLFIDTMIKEQNTITLCRSCQFKDNFYCYNPVNLDRHLKVLIIEK
jgi:hypothetical protein